MLVLDSTIGCIETSEAEVLDLYRSAPVARASSGNSKPETLEAYVCAIKKKAQVKVYLALVADDRKIYVYTEAGKNQGEEGHQRTVQKALVCARSMGFSPQPVDLSYSPAMREVVVRNTKILRPPRSKAGAYLKHGLPGAPTLPIAATPEPAGQQAAAPSPIPQPIPERPSIPTAVQTSMPPLTPDLENEVQELRSALSKCRDELYSVTAERDAQSVQLRQLSVQHQAIVEELAGANEACDRLAVGRDALVPRMKQLEELIPEKDALEESLRELGALQQNTVAEMSRAVEECARLTAERDALIQAAQRAKQASCDLALLQQEVAELVRQNQEADRHHKELSAESAALAGALARARQEVEKVSAERDAALKSADRVAGESRESDAQIEAVHAELVTVCAEKEAALLRIEALELQKATAAGELVALRRELALLKDEHEMLLEKHKESSALAAAAMAAERPGEKLFPESPEILPAHEGEPQPGTAAKSAAGWPDPQEGRFELPALADFPGVPGAEDITTSSGVQAPDFTSFGDPHGDFFSAFSASDEGSSPVRFLLDPGLAAIEYLCPEEVVELHQSINNAYLSPDGKGQESCRGYICCLKKGASLHVFAAIYGTQSGRISVYLPESQPENETGCAGTVRGAIRFAEDVGLMMEPVPLDSPDQWRECLKRCPALRMTVQK